MTTPAHRRLLALILSPVRKLAAIVRPDDGLGDGVRRPVKPDGPKPLAVALKEPMELLVKKGKR